MIVLSKRGIEEYLEKSDT